VTIHAQFILAQGWQIAGQRRHQLALLMIVAVLGPPVGRPPSAQALPAGQAALIQHKALGWITLLLYMYPADSPFMLGGTTSKIHWNYLSTGVAVEILKKSSGSWDRRQRPGIIWKVRINDGMLESRTAPPPPRPAHLWSRWCVQCVQCVLRNAVDSAPS